MEQKQPYTVLAVDDNRLNLKLIEKSLSKEGYRIFCADNGPDARTIALKEKPDQWFWI
jgi:sigma-B regulation protein RsbU (phosphoserine phosphatase)